MVTNQKGFRTTWLDVVNPCNIKKNTHVAHGHNCLFEYGLLSMNCGSYKWLKSVCVCVCVFRVKKLKETLVTVQQLDKNMSNLRSWLCRMEAELSRPITYSVCHHQEIQKRLAEQQVAQNTHNQCLSSFCLRFCFSFLVLPCSFLFPDMFLVVSLSSPYCLCGFNSIIFSGSLSLPLTLCSS